ncbi:phage integrase family protein [Paraburkholderia sabiae]|uniref:Phage integrase family protein n=1 Tax=Paraburkholderia sabiae TaxID=273251 RepID=A0ABU9QMI0_9BURK|nr:phage integrase family protein [Paraburkholderia sabiae]WJZ79134.1 phage integrase family protein [Paraburkholderia sabiae]CAD6514399.1 hypothetical protein LMG24235_00910 [Paraburkholderia sabiae]
MVAKKKATQRKGDGHLVVTGRRVGLCHASFYRACVDGMGGADAAAWYLDAETETREPGVVFDEITEALLVAARRHHAGRTVAILDHVRAVFHHNAESGRVESVGGKRGRSRSRPPPSPLPGGERGAWLRRQALDEVIRWTGDGPCATEMLTDWLCARVTGCLAAYGVATVGELARLIASGGWRWSHAVPGLGTRRGKRLEAWLQQRAPDLLASETLAHAQRQRPPAPGLLQPFDRFAVVPDLDGREGSNRDRYWRPHRPEWAPVCDDDRAALTAWLDQYRGNEQTFVSYRRMVERIWLWAVLVRSKAFSSLTAEDCIAYFAFLRDLPEDWVHHAPRGTPRHVAEGWRPFGSAVGPTSLENHFSCMRTLFAGLYTWRYLDSNPMREIRLSDIDGGAHAEARAASGLNAQAFWLSTDPTRTFTAEQWSFLLQFAARSSVYPHEKRAAFMLRFCYYVGLRFSELQGRRVMHLIPPACDGSKGWALKVVGPRELVRAAVIPEPAFVMLRNYMVERGHPAEPAAWHSEAPLVGQLATGRGRETGEAASLGSIDRSMRRFFGRAAAAASTAHPEWAGQITRASGLWLRASLARHGMARGVSFVALSDRLGYASVHTFEHFESPPVDHAASMRNWNRFFSESIRAAQARASRQVSDEAQADEAQASAPDADTHRGSGADDGDS